MTSPDRSNLPSQIPDSSMPEHQPRICMPSGRLFKKKTFLCGHYEAQDVLAQIDNVDLICLEADPRY